MVRFAAIALLASVFTSPISAQVSVVGARDLHFGFVPLGVPTAVLPTDPVKSGQWTLTAPVGTRIQIRLTSPNQLLGPAGATMPASFLNGDVFVQGTWSGALPEFFNPNATKNFRFTGGTQAILRLGGQVSPAGNQSTGPYANTVVCTINVN